MKWFLVVLRAQGRSSVKVERNNFAGIVSGDKLLM